MRNINKGLTIRMWVIVMTSSILLLLHDTLNNTSTQGNLSNFFLKFLGIIFIAKMY